jgi:ABC-type dipeptide/oligopeptide/nickel transport system permease component
LMGLGKLKDLRIAKQNRGSVFDEIITGIMTLRRSVPFFVLYDSFSAMVRRKRFISAS